jgi:hypothetical protein
MIQNKEHKRAVSREDYLKNYREDHREEHRKYCKKYFADNREILVARNKEYKKNNPEIVKAIAARCYTKNPERSARKQLKQRYGVTLEFKQGLFESQDNKCGACGTTDPGPKPWALDHDHATGAFRGVLCYTCNVTLGLLKDSSERCLQLAAYLNFKPDFSFEVL